jgi:hypothetical protein
MSVLTCRFLGSQGTPLDKEFRGNGRTEERADVIQTSKRRRSRPSPSLSATAKTGERRDSAWDVVYANGLGLGLAGWASTAWMQPRPRFERRTRRDLLE